MFRELLRIIKQGAVLMVGNVAQRVMQFALLPIYTRLLSPADFGIIEMLTIFSTIIRRILKATTAPGIAGGISKS